MFILQLLNKGFELINMSKISIGKIRVNGEDYPTLCIDDLPLASYMEKFTEDDFYHALWLAWLPLYDEVGEAYIHTLLEQKQNVNLPILVCPDDLDLQCVVVVAKVCYKNENVYWEKIGVVTWLDWKNDAEEQNKDYKTKTTSHWSDSYVLAGFDAPEEIWASWYSKSKSETDAYYIWNILHPYLNDDKNIKWLGTPLWVFDLQSYENCVTQLLSVKDS